MNNLSLNFRFILKIGKPVNKTRPSGLRMQHLIMCNYSLDECDCDINEDIERIEEILLVRII